MKNPTFEEPVQQTPTPPNEAVIVRQQRLAMTQVVMLSGRSSSVEDAVRQAEVVLGQKCGGCSDNRSFYFANVEGVVDFEWESLPEAIGAPGLPTLIAPGRFAFTGSGKLRHIDPSSATKPAGGARDAS